MSDDRKKQVSRIQQYHSNPLLWVDDVFGDNIKLTTQQKQAFVDIGKLIQAKLKLASGGSLREEEREYSKKIGISIMSGMGTGKDFWSALVILYFLSVFYDPHLLATANSAKQLRNVLWKEIAKVMGLAKKVGNSGLTILEEIFEWQSERIFLKEKKGKTWFAEAVTVSPHASEDEQAKALTGRHADFMLFVVDEAAGVPEPVFGNLEGTLTGKLNIILMIFNPIKATGYALRSHGAEKSKWVALRWNAEESERVSKEHIENFARYGKDSNTYRVKVLGLPPKAESDALIPWEWIQDAVNRDIGVIDDPVIKGVDVGAGGDRSVILTRQGSKVLKITSFTEADTMAFTGRVAQELLRDVPEAAFIDVIGIGKGVYDRLKEQGYQVHAADVRRSSISDRFRAKRDELWWRVREQFESSLISIPEDQELMDELGNIKIKAPDSSGKTIIESKQEMKRRIGHSPDKADALCLSYYHSDAIFRKGKGNKKTAFKDRYQKAFKRA